MTLVTLDVAKEHLRVTGSDDDVNIQSKLNEAENWATDIMGENFDPDWTDETMPGRIRSAILVYLTAVYDGDYESKTLHVANLLIERWRDHTAV